MENNYTSIFDRQSPQSPQEPIANFEEVTEVIQKKEYKVLNNVYSRTAPSADSRRAEAFMENCIVEAEDYNDKWIKVDEQCFIVKRCVEEV